MNSKLVLNLIIYDRFFDILTQFYNSILLLVRFNMNRFIYTGNNKYFIDLIIQKKLINSYH